MQPPDEKIELDFTSTETTIEGLIKVRELKHHLSNIQTQLEIAQEVVEKSEKQCINALIDGKQYHLSKSIYYIPGRFKD